MRNAKIFGILLSALLLTACGGQPNTLFDTASPESSLMALYVYDGAEMTCYYLSDDAAEHEILGKLKNTSAVPAEVTTADVKFPAYGFDIGTSDGWGLYMTWANGYLYNRDGQVYGFDFDFDDLLTDYAFTEEWSRTDGMALPCMRYLVQDENGWNAALMNPAAEPEAPGGITVEIDYTGDTIEAKFRNGGTEAWGFGTYWSLQVNLGGVWYEVPVSPVSNWAFPDIGYELAPGGTWDETYHMEMYGDLPAGQYRFYAFGVTADFTVE